MFFQLIKFDLVGLRRDGIALTVLATLVIACLLALANGRAVIVEREQGLQQFTGEVARKQAALPTPVAPNAIARTVTLPTGPLAGLSLGRTRLDPWFGSVTYSTLESRIFSNYQTSSPIALQAGGFDLGFIATVVAPLLIIALGYGIITADRDAGRLRAVLSYPISARAWLIVRLVLRILLVGIPMSFLAVVGAFWTDPGADPILGPLLLWLAIAWISMTFWWALVAFVNTFNVRAEAAGITLVSIWAALTLVIPALAAAGAAALYPPPSRQALTVAIRQSEVAARDSAPAELKRLRHDHPEFQQEGGASIAEWMKASVVQRNMVEAQLRPDIDAFEARLEDQQRVAGLANFLSPALGLSYGLSEIAGTGEARHRAFREQAITYKMGIQDRLQPYMLAARPIRTTDIPKLGHFVFSEIRSTHLLAVTLMWTSVAFAILLIAVTKARHLHVV